MRTLSADSLQRKDAHQAGMRKLGVDSLELLYREEPALLIGPIAAALLLKGLWLVPAFTRFAAARALEPWGLANAAHYTVFALLLSYAFHGFVCTHVPPHLKLQQAKPNHERPASVATRNSAILLTELVDTFLPVRPPSSSWLHFAAALCAFTFVWDVEFFVVHKAAHESRWLYVRLHKLHHAIKDPCCFAAYFVKYQSHVLLEQLVVVLCCLAFLPRDVFVFVLYTCTLGTYIEHAGCDIKQLRLPFARVRVAHVLAALTGSPLAGALGVMSTSHHDWHHEKFTANYALYFTWLDRLCGTYHPGRSAEIARANAENQKSAGGLD